MFSVDLSFEKLIEKYYIEFLFSFAVGLLLYMTAFDKEWEWPTLVGCALFLILRLAVILQKKRNSNKRNRYYNELMQNRIEKNEREMREAAKIFLHNCTEIAVSLYNHPKHPGERENERYVSFGEQPGFNYAIQVSHLSLDSFNDKYHFLYCDNELEASHGGIRHIVFHPIFYELVKKYIETGIISF